MYLPSRARAEHFPVSKTGMVEYFGRKNLGILEVLLIFASKRKD